MKKICILCLITSIAFFTACAQKRYKDPSTVDTVDKKVRVLEKEASEPEINIDYNGGKTVEASIRKKVKKEVERKYEKKYKRCWEIKRGLLEKDEDNPIKLITFMAIDIASIPFAILQAVSDPVEPGCNYYTKWTDWEEIDSPQIKTTKYSGPVSFSLQNGHAAEPTPGEINVENGKAQCRLEFEYPYLARQQAQGLNEKQAESTKLYVKIKNAVTKSKTIKYYDISPYLDEFVSNNFEKIKLSLENSNSRYPIKNALVNIEMNNEFNISDYIKRQNDNMHIQKYLVHYIKNNYTNLLKGDTYRTRSNDLGKIDILIPKKGPVRCKNLEIKHKKYYYREIENIQLSKNIHIDTEEKNIILMDEIGSKVRTEDVEKKHY